MSHLDPEVLRMMERIEDRASERDRQIAQLDRVLAGHAALAQRNTEILDDIRKHLNKPVNWAEWITASASAAAAVGAIIWAFWVQPLEIAVADIRREMEDRDVYIQAWIDRNGMPPGAKPRAN